MSDNVVSIVNGAQVVPPGEPRPALIEFLEELTEMARSGELDGIAIACLYRTDATNHAMRGRVTRSLIGALQLASFELCKLDGED